MVAPRRRFPESTRTVLLTVVWGLVGIAGCGLGHSLDLSPSSGSVATRDDAASSDSAATDAATGSAIDATLAVDSALADADGDSTIALDATPSGDAATPGDAGVMVDANVNDGTSPDDATHGDDASPANDAEPPDDAPPATDAIAPDDATAAFDANGVATIPPPWELDGSAADAGCEGELLDSGACLVTLAQAANPLGMALDGTSVYWCNQGSGPVLPSIAKVGRFGGATTTLAAGNVGSPYDVTVDNTYVYWSGDAVRAVPLDGGAVTTLFDDYNSQVRFITRAGTRVYWADLGHDFGVRSAFLDGSGFEQTTSGELQIGGVAPTALGFVYSVDSDTVGDPELIVAESFAGGVTSTSLAPAIPGLVRSAYGIVVFTGYSSTGDRTISSLPIGGGAPKVIATGFYPSDVITDGTYVYWTDQNLRAVMKLDIATGTSHSLVSHADDTRINGDGSITIDSTSVYFTEYGGCQADGGGCEGTVLKLTPR